jgi:uncharacterized membrane protein
MSSEHNQSFYKNVSLNIRNRLLSGIFVIVPFAVTIVIIFWLFNALKGFLEPIVNKVLAFLLKIHLMQQLPEHYVKYAISVATILCLLFIIYLIGAIAKFVAGRKLLALGETLVMRIPLASTIYSATKQVTTALSLPDNTAFKSVVMVEFPRKGLYSLGFLTGNIRDNTNSAYCKIFIPTCPNPTTGFFIMLPASEVFLTKMTVEEAFKMIISGGIVAPDTFSITVPISQNQNLIQ